ncbi:MAG: HlyD family type I secretion periplasmic adaptor subunit [Pseudomonadota bacterium]
MTDQAPPAPPPSAPARAFPVMAVLRWLGPQGPLSVRDLVKALLPGGGFGPQGERPPGGRLAALADHYPLPTWRPLARLVMLLVLLFLAWAVFAHLDEFAMAEGEVVPEGKVKLVQHLEGGIIREIYVQDGSVVKEGEPLVQLDLPVGTLNREELQVRLDGLVLQRARLEAELAGTRIDFPPEEAKRQPTLVEAEIRNHQTRAEALAATLSVIHDQTRQREAEVRELDARMRSTANNLRLTRERLKMSQDLMKSGLTPRMEHVALEAQVGELEGLLETLRASIPRAQAAMAEAKSRADEEKARFVRNAQTELSEVELTIQRTRELLSQASDQQRRTQITSPIDGIVKSLRYNTIGGVVKPGDPIMEIVPLNERLQVDVKLSPSDRGYVQVGQKATVKISAYDYTTYGGLDGEVVLVAPDTTLTPENQPYYRVVVQTDRAWLGDERGRYPITAGMQASVEIHTGTRTVMEYLVKPVIKLRHEAFRER